MLGSLSPIPALPRYLGPYPVASTEYEIPVAEISTDVPLESTHPETLKLRLFYPTSASSPQKQPLYWMPSPQRQWTAAYASFLGASERLSSFIAHLPAFLNYTKIPAIADGPLRDLTESRKYPVVIFSHGLGGNLNTYSSILGNLASCGVVCATVEHRDGSAPITHIRTSPADILKTIPYQRVAHNPNAEVLSTRNAQLRIRLREIDLLYNVLNQFNAGKSFTDFTTSTHQPQLHLTNKLDLAPGRVAWMGHSFGSTTIVQFIKSVYYHGSLPSLKGTPYENDPDWKPLYTAGTTSRIVQQIQRSSPVVLLDVWTMPFRGESTQWLWEKPLPCHDTSSSNGQNNDQNTKILAIISDEFYNYTDLLKRTRALLSSRPVETLKKLERESQENNPLDSSDTHDQITLQQHRQPISTVPEDLVDSTTSTTTTSHDPPSNTSSQSPSPSPLPSSTTSLSTPATAPSPSKPQPKTLLFRIPQSAHLSQSDFGVLFPRVTKWLMKAHDPEDTIRINVLGILAFLRGCHVPLDTGGIEELKQGVNWTEDGKRWVRVPLE